MCFFLGGGRAQREQAEFHQTPVPSTGVIEALISINNQLQQPDAAVGILKVRHKELFFFRVQTAKHGHRHSRAIRWKRPR